MSTKLTHWQKRALKKLRSRINLDSASLQFTQEQMDAMNGRSRSVSDHDTKEIKEASRRYNNTWVLPLLDAVLKGDRDLAEAMSR
ncbi:MAG: hypothetical protein COA96_17045 [SAR86 cluster bacterium]|uniref:Uncharacterized protein n=1 Tax=SAR86 cluster bacterium TaxID=2030880 RepID=A0A2A5AGF3_9GAMM|nr:MAG: hypothetical protein COA96_17045 [SAR86 cluster bacterium]